MIPFNKPCLEGREIANVMAAIEGGKIAGDGKYTLLCQQEIAAAIGAERVLLTQSGTNALELSALIYDLGPGDEVIMPSFTFVTTASAFCLRGVTPVFVDIRPDTLNMDPALVAAAVTERTKAIVPVHYAGVACDMAALQQIADRHGLKIIEDAAHGFLATADGRYLGTMGDIGCFSFHETKTFISGEGGAIVLKHPEDIERAEILRDKGTNRAAFFRGEVDKYTWVGLGSSMLPSDIIAAFLYGQFEAREEILSQRRAIYTNYQRLLQPLADRGLITLGTTPDGCVTNDHMFYLLTEDLETRGDLIGHLKQRQIHAVFHYVPLHSSPFARSLGVDVELPITDSVAGRLLRLPFYNSLTMSEQDQVVDAIYEFYRLDPALAR